MRRSPLGAALVLLWASAPALAQARNPFSVGVSEGGGSATGWTGWLLAQQGWFEHQLAVLVRAAKTDGSAFWSLVGLSLVYGVLHAAGPGHGKAVLASYMVSNERALRRGIVLSFLAALLQGLVAIVLIGVLALVLHATAQRMRDAAALVETASFAGIACLGAWLVWRKGRAAWALSRRLRRDPALPGVGRALPQEMWFGPAETSALSRASFSVPTVGLSYRSTALRLQDSGGAMRGAADSGSRFACLEADPSHVPGCPHCQVDPARLRGATLSWREAGPTVLAAGLRPCSGAILVLVFALAQGLFLTGVAAVLAMALGVAVTTASLASIAVLAKGAAAWLARPGSAAGLVLMAGLELLAALAVLLVGVSLLLGTALTGGA